MAQRDDPTDLPEQSKDPKKELVSGGKAQAVSHPALNVIPKDDGPLKHLLREYVP